MMLLYYYYVICKGKNQPLAIYELNVLGSNHIPRSKLWSEKDHHGVSMLNIHTYTLYHMSCSLFTMMNYLGKLS